MKRYSFSALLISALIGIVVCTAAFALVFFIIFGGKSERSRATAKFSTIYETIENNYIGDADMQDVSDIAYAAMVEELDDRWSYYMTAEEYGMYKEYQSNSYTGIGISIAASEKGSYMKVLSISEDSPAARAGVLIGDLLTSIDGESLENKSPAKIKSMISDRDGKEFTLGLIGSDGSSRTALVSTEVVMTSAVKFQILDNGIGYVKIKNFEQDSGSGIIEAVDSLISQGASGIIFDVRNNPGGKLSELLNALDYLLPEGKMFISVDRDGNESIHYSDTEFVEIPTAVLVNGNSYSAAEFFAKGLSEYGLASIVGNNTTGKSRSQVNIVLSDGSAVHISTNRYLTPSGIDLAEEGGITPDVQVDMTDEDAVLLLAGLLDIAEDEQIQTAVRILCDLKE